MASIGISPWEFKLEHTDYNRIVKEFGLETFTDELLARMKSPHRLFRRKLVFAHRNFQAILEAQEKGEEYVVLSGMMPSGRFHFGHKLIAELLAWYQGQGARIFIPISDIEAYVVRGLKMEDIVKIAVDEYILNYIALGIDLTKPEKCLIYSQWKNEHVKNLAFKLSVKVTASTFRAMFDFVFEPSKEDVEKGRGSDTIGKIFYPLIDAADILSPQLPEFGGPKPVLVPVGVDQDVYIRLCHDLAPKFGMVKPSSIYTKMMCGLQGPGTKMSSSKPETAIFLKDPPEVADKKLRDAFTGGRPTAKEQKELGGQPEICVPYMFLLFHFEDDLLKKVFEECKAGTLLCGECKAIISERVCKFLREHQEKLEKARDILPTVIEEQPFLYKKQELKGI